jgi:hypothetical protein
MSIDVNLNEDLSTTFYHGRTVIGQTASQVVDRLIGGLTKGIQIKVGPTEKGVVYVGKDGVTKGTYASTDGMPFQSGEGLFLPIRDASEIYAISTKADTDVYWVAV